MIVHGQIQRGGWGENGDLDPLKNHKNMEYLSNTCSDPLKNHLVTKPAFNVGPSSVRKRNAIQMAWRFAGEPKMARLQWYLNPLSLHQLKNKVF